MVAFVGKSTPEIEADPVFTYARVLSFRVENRRSDPHILLFSPHAKTWILRRGCRSSHDLRRRYLFIGFDEWNPPIAATSRGQLGR